jgi:hypothetical protein
MDAGRELDLRQFYRIVQSYGGYETSTSERHWYKIAKKLGIDTTVITNASFVLR